MFFISFSELKHIPDQKEIYFKFELHMEADNIPTNGDQNKNLLEVRDQQQ